jgi:hypothetical protein
MSNTFLVRDRVKALTGLVEFADHAALRGRRSGGPHHLAICSATA